MTTEAPRHTPGPWVIEGPTAHHTTTVWAKRGGPDDKHIIGIAQFGPQEMIDANARLISAAPDLLDACEALVDSFFVGSRPEDFVRNIAGLIHEAQEAIRKARGS